MADSTSPIQQVVAGSGAAQQVNENFGNASPASLYARNPVTSTGLTWGFVGGRFAGLAVASGTVTLTASTTNYVVALRSTGAVSTSTTITNFNDPLYVQLYQVVTGVSTVTSYLDYRQAVGLPTTAFTGGTLISALNEAPTVTIASSATPAIFAAAGNTISMTGVVTVTGFDTIAAGAFRRVVFTGALVLTHNATSMINLTGANITTAAGDVAEFLSLGAGNTRMLAYERASGAANATPRPVSVLTTSAGVVNIDLALGDFFTLALSANVTSITFSNLPGASQGATKWVRITQDAVTARTVAWPASFRWEGAAPVVSTALSAVDLLTLITLDNGTKWDSTLSKGRV